MRALLWACALPAGLAAAITLSADNSVSKRFEEWARTHKVKFADAAEYAERLQVFKENAERIERHQADPYRFYDIGLTRYAHMSAQELARRGASKGCVLDNASTYSRRLGNDELPPQVDWRVKHVFSPVLSETSWCRSSYALGTVATVEAYLALDQGELVQLSSQQVLDCSTSFGNRHCEGGTHMNAYAYLKSIGGLQNMRTYPQSANATQQCRYKPASAVAQVTGVTGVGLGKPAREAEQDMAEVLAMQGPLTVGFNLPDDFHLYTGGVYRTRQCSRSAADVDYTLVIVGYNTTDASNPYWIARAAFGPDFGYGGHVNIAKDHNVCGIASCSAYPQVHLARSPS